MIYKEKKALDKNCIVVGILLGMTAVMMVCDKDIKDMFDE